MPDAPKAIDSSVNTTTAVTATMAATRTLTHAFYGVNADDGTLHVEINLGGYTTCPEMNSPTANYVLVIPRVPSTAPTGAGLSSFLDYVGDMLPSPDVFQSASSVMLTGIEYQAGTYVAFDMMLTFPAGPVSGHAYAVHCTSMDG